VIENSELVETIHRAPLFIALDDESANALRKSMDEVRLTRGQTLFSEGDQAERLYVIGEGKIKLGTVSADGRENLLSVLGPGDMFGELSLFDLKPRASTATAVTDARLFSLGNDDLQELLRVRPEVSFYLLQSLAQRFRRVSEIVEDLVFSDVPGRVAKALIQLSGRF
jgi:CRP-like cAMP-binding protein